MGRWSQNILVIQYFAVFRICSCKTRPKGTFTTNFVQKLDEEALHAAHMIMRLKAAGYRTFDPTKEAEDAYCKEIYRKSGRGQKVFTAMYTWIL